MAYTLTIARLSDRQVVDALIEIARDVGVSGANINVSGIDGAMGFTVPIEEVASHKELQQVISLNSSIFVHFRLRAGDKDVVRIDRPDSEVFDRVNFYWQNASQASLNADQFTRIAALAKEKLREIKINSEFSASGVASFDAITRVRFSELEELRSIAGQVTIRAHDYLAELDRKFAERVAALEENANAARKAAAEDLDRERARLEARSTTLDAREAEIDRSDAKAARRKLRENLQKTLREHSQKFELSKTTRRLRWPIAALLIAILLATAWLAYASFADLTAAVASPQVDWWRLLLVSFKQFFFAATFLGFAAYTLRWFEGWSKRHADAEFRFKQLELDIDRASWVVEVAQEWHKDQGKEVPADLLAQLSSHLFSDTADSNEQSDNISTALFGAAARLKFVSPAGEIEIDKGGLRRLRKARD